MADSEHALADFSASANTPFQRPRWVALITILRTVGLVLRAVDRPAADPQTQGRIDSAWKHLNDMKPEPRIFHDFINAERNDTVHLYDIGAGVNITIQLGGVATGGVSSQSGPARYDFVMRDGPYKDRDPRELAREAIEFWKTYLDKIDRP